MTYLQLQNLWHSIQAMNKEINVSSCVLELGSFFVLDIPRGGAEFSACSKEFRLTDSLFSDMGDDSEFLISCPCLSDSAGHPYFFNQLSQGLDVISMAGEWLAATANTNMFTYEIAPVFSLMESEVGNDAGSFTVPQKL